MREREREREWEWESKARSGKARQDKRQVTSDKRGMGTWSCQS